MAVLVIAQIVGTVGVGRGTFDRRAAGLAGHRQRGLGRPGPQREHPRRDADRPAAGQPRRPPAAAGSRAGHRLVDRRRGVLLVAAAQWSLIVPLFAGLLVL